MKINRANVEALAAALATVGMIMYALLGAWFA